MITKRKQWLSLFFIILSGLLYANEPEHWKLTPTPPMGWNSYDCFGSSVTEEEVLANAKYMSENLKKMGYEYIVVDYRWSDATAADYKPNGIGGPLVADKYGRLLPAPNRFPSAANGIGFKALADKIHAMGLKFGIHVMRGIPRQSVRDNNPIEGSEFFAVDAADVNSKCPWCKDMWGIDATTKAGQDYYDSLFRLYASWGVDYVKVDDLSRPYHKDEIEAVRKAIDRCGRPMVLSTSPGDTPVEEARHVADHANLWRISRDFWDRWRSLNKNFDLAYAWQESGVAGPGRWPDGDMIPIGKIGHRCEGGERMTEFTKDEQIALMSLLAIMPSPLMLGMNMPENDKWTYELIANPEMLAINQDPLGAAGRRVFKNGTAEIWIKKLSDGTNAIAIFNRGDMIQDIVLDESLGLSENTKLFNVWKGKIIGKLGHSRSFAIPSHGAVLLRTSKTDKE